MTTTEVRRTITQSYLTGAHGPMRYWSSEPRQGVPVLLIHGYGGLIEHWRSVMRPIARRHTVYALDLYNFGYSARPVERPSKELWAAQIAEFIEKVIGTPAVVIGHSMGGMAVAHFAASYHRLVRGLALVNSTGLMLPGREPSLFDQGFYGLVRAPLLGEVLATFAANEWMVRQGLLNAYHRKERVTDELVKTFTGPLLRPGGATPYLAATRSFDNFFLKIKPDAITAPALLIWGEEDQSIPVALAEHFKRTFLPQAELHILANSGHCPFDETPEAFCDALLPWLDRLAM